MVNFGFLYGMRSFGLHRVGIRRPEVRSSSTDIFPRFPGTAYFEESFEDARLRGYTRTVPSNPTWPKCPSTEDKGSSTDCRQHPILERRRISPGLRCFAFTDVFPAIRNETCAPVHDSSCGMQGGQWKK